MLRDYQQRAIDQLYDWMRQNKGHPCLVLPTGSGKSHIVAALCKDALQNWPDTRVLMLTHVKELIEQNAEYMHRCEKIVSVGRVKWIPGSKMTGKDNCCWYLFDREFGYADGRTQFFGR